MNLDFGLFHNAETCQFAHFQRTTYSNNVYAYQIMVGGDFTPTPTEKMAWTNFEDGESARRWLRNHLFYPVNNIVILCARQKRASIEADHEFWSRISAVYGMETTSVVYFNLDKTYSETGLCHLMFRIENMEWLWYDRETDAALETWIDSQIFEEIARLALEVNEPHEYSDVYQNRTIFKGRFTRDSENRFFLHREGICEEF